MAKTLIVCCDGTWNTPTQEENNLPAPTNVVKLYNSIAPSTSDGTCQLSYYHPGVGTEGGFLDKTAGGMYGAGLDANIKSAYMWIAEHYQKDDKLFFFGFSRGAYTARSVAAMIGMCGLPILKGISSEEAWNRVNTAYENGYSPLGRSQAFSWPAAWPWINAPVPIEFVGVWDTVGALGIPDDLALINLLDKSDHWRFEDSHLGSHVKCARHALALDEMRASFTPTLWTDPHTHQPIYGGPDDRIHQLWFIGVHSDVGGGYSSSGLSDITLKWMIDEATKKGLCFENSFINQIKPDFQAPVHDSFKGVFKAFQSRPRNVPHLPGSTLVHDTVKDRITSPPITQAPYRKSIHLKKGESISVDIFAAQPWNYTSLYLSQDEIYHFTSNGQWIDRNITCGPEGASDGHFQPGELMHLIGSAYGKLETLFHSASNNPKADFKFTKRIEGIPWFCLVAVLANDGIDGKTNPSPDGSPTPHQLVYIAGKTKAAVTITRPGYLYAFANDAWGMYNNNCGKITLTVTRIA